MSSGVATYCDVCEEVANSSGMDKSAPFGLSGSSTPMWGGAPKTANGGSLPGVLCWETGIEVGGSAAAFLKPPEYGG